MAGAKPKRQVTDMASDKENASARQSVSSTSRTGLSVEASIETTIGAAQAPNSVPTAVAAIASKALSTSTRRTNRQRSAPIETRSAISRPRDSAWPSRRLATLVHAIRRTSKTSAARIHRGTRKLL